MLLFCRGKLKSPTVRFELNFSKISSALSSPPSVNSIMILLQLALDTFTWSATEVENAAVVISENQEYMEGEVKREFLNG